MRVSKDSKPAHIAGALAGSLRSGDTENLDVMGRESTYIAVKAIILTGLFVEEYGIEPVVRIRKAETLVGKDEVERTFLRLTVSPEKVDENA